MTGTEANDEVGSRSKGERGGKVGGEKWSVEVDRRKGRKTRTGSRNAWRQRENQS